MQKVIAAHIIITAYGFWLPNDPRGSWSDFVASWELLKFGKATKVSTRKSVAHIPHDRKLRQAAKAAMLYDPVRFTGVQARAIARGFARAAGEGEYPIHACAILPDHVHLVIGLHSRPYERITSHLKSRATRQLKLENLHPFQDDAKRNGILPSVWARKLWKVFCDDPAHVRNAIEYVEKNPIREGKTKQTWSFVTPWAQQNQQRAQHTARFSRSARRERPAASRVERCAGTDQKPTKTRRIGCWSIRRRRFWRCEAAFAPVSAAGRAPRAQRLPLKDRFAMVKEKRRVWRAQFVRQTNRPSREWCKVLLKRRLGEVAF